ncbi:RES family NAD+ phosphorylase [Pseudactinotalea sp. Z1748]|uniref:RES family NAD+ phosphorylase n=1 Tax=Pseudactinotalea sp. Z1748 TaxID=3413027 RepID=UPI003C7E2AD0
MATPKKRSGIGRQIEHPLHPDDQFLVEQKEAYYSNFDWDEYRARRDRYWKLDLSRSDVDAPAEVRHVIQAGNDQTALTSFSWHAWYPGEIHLWRTRKVSREKAYQGYWVEDLWEPPPRKSIPGRFNHAGEPLLYACLDDPWAAIREARVAGRGDIFIVMKYALVGGELRVKRIGVPHPDSNLRWGHRAIEYEISMFIEAAIRAPAGDHGPDTYGFTRELLHEFYPLAGGQEEGWMYESVQVPQAWNLALPPNVAHRLLELRGVVVGVVAEEDNGGLDFRVEMPDWTDSVTPLNGGRIGFPTFKPELKPGQTPLDVLPD